MADGEKQCRPFFDSASGLVALTFDVAGQEIELLPGRIIEALGDAKVQKAIKDALDKEAKALMEERAAGKAAAPDRGEKVLEKLGKASFDALSAEVQRKVESSPQVKKLESEAKQVLKDFECSPVGIWVNENKTVLIIVAAVLALGTGAALYFTKSGDFVGTFAEGKGKTIKVGSIEISGKLTKFQPSKQAVGATVGVAGKWKPLKASFNLSGLFTADKNTVSVDGRIVVPLTGPLSASTEYRFDLGDPLSAKDPRMRLFPADSQTGWNQFHYRVAAGLTYDTGSLKVDLLGVVDNNRPSGSVKAAYQANVGDWRLNAGAGADIELGNVTGKGTVGLTSRRKDLPLEFVAGGTVNGKGVYKLEAGLKITF